MKAKIRKISHGGRGDADRSRARHQSADLSRGRDCSHRQPFAGRYQEDLSELIDVGEELGGLLAERAVKALGIDPTKTESYGRAAAVGANGELEHAAAILHPKLGAPFPQGAGQGCRR